MWWLAVEIGIRQLKSKNIKDHRPRQGLGRGGEGLLPTHPGERCIRHSPVWVCCRSPEIVTFGVSHITHLQGAHFVGSCRLSPFFPNRKRCLTSENGSSHLRKHPSMHLSGLTLGRCLCKWTQRPFPWPLLLRAMMVQVSLGGQSLPLPSWEPPTCSKSGLARSPCRHSIQG